MLSKIQVSYTYLFLVIILFMRIYQIQILVIVLHSWMIHLIQIVSMKTTNQFDYPTALATNYKAFREQPSSANPSSKQRYKNIIQQESRKERGRAKQEQYRKMQQQKQEQQKRLREQIEKKKKQLQELQRKRVEAIQNQIRAVELAKIKEQQDKLKKVQQIQKLREADSNAQFRFRDALRRLEYEKEQNSYKERQAQHRRKVNLQIEKEEREKANRFKNIQSLREQEERIRAKDEQKKQEELYRQGLGRHGLAKNIDYSKTCFHNPSMVFKVQNSETTALEKAQAEYRKQKSRSMQKQQEQAKRRQRSIERHQNAMQKLQKERQYNLYCAETEQQQIQYNLYRIEAGKRNQFTGIKPITLDQMQSNKKIRSEQQFEDMFIQSPKNNVGAQPANNYSIVQDKYHQPRTSAYQAWKRTTDLRETDQAKPPITLLQEVQPNSEGEEELRYISQVPQSIGVQQKEDSKIAVGSKAERRQNAHQQLSYSESEEDSNM